ncbi:MAG TPA: hypothetical protein PK470_05565, partial [Candidatus Omnitrophota bacterium]|nr:hypothetical protein [Candidatus Omnitrophota bacterium]
NLLSVAQVVLDAFPRDASSSPITRREFLKYVIQGGIGITVMSYGAYHWMAFTNERDKAGMAALEVMTGASQESLAVRMYVTRVYEELYGARPSEAHMFEPIPAILKALKTVEKFAPYIQQAARHYQVDATLLASVLFVETMDLAPLEKETDSLGSLLKKLTRDSADILPEPSVGPFQMRASIAMDILGRFGGYEKYFGVADRDVRSWSRAQKVSRFGPAVTELLHAKTDAGKSFAAHMAAGYLKFLMTELGQDEKRVLAGYTSDYKRLKTQELYEGPFNTAFEKKVFADKDTAALYAATRYAISGVEAKELIRQMKLLKTSSSPLAVNDSWQMMLELSQEGPLKVSSPVSGEEHLRSTDGIVPLSIHELLPVFPSWTLPVLWPQMIQAPVPPADHKRAGRSHPWQPVIPARAMTDILPSGIGVIDYSRVWAAVLSGVQGLQRAILMGRLNEIFEILKASGKNYIHTGLSPPKRFKRSDSKSVAASRNVTSRKLDMTGTVRIKISVRITGNDGLVSSPVEQDAFDKNSRPEHIQQAHKLIRSLRVGPQSRVVTVGPGDYCIGKGDRRNVEAFWTPWELLFLEAGAQLTVYEPDKGANRLWRAFAGRHFENQIAVESVDRALFEQARLSQNSVDAVIMMSVLSYPALSDAVKKQMAYKAGEILRPGATLLVGWFAFDESRRRVEEERSITPLQHLKARGYGLSLLAEGIEPVNPWRNLKRHEWRAYSVHGGREGKSSSPIAAKNAPVHTPAGVTVNGVKVIAALLAHPQMMAVAPDVLAAYVFGSSLWSQQPSDIDVVLIVDTARIEAAFVAGNLDTPLGNIQYHCINIQGQELTAGLLGSIVLALSLLFAEGQEIYSRDDHALDRAWNRLNVQTGTPWYYSVFNDQARSLLTVAQGSLHYVESVQGYQFGETSIKEALNLAVKNVTTAAHIVRRILEERGVRLPVISEEDVLSLRQRGKEGRVEAAEVREMLGKVQSLSGLLRERLLKERGSSSPVKQQGNKTGNILNPIVSLEYKSGVWNFKYIGEDDVRQLDVEEIIADFSEYEYITGKDNFDYPFRVEDDGNGVILHIGEGLPGFEAGQARITFDFERGMNRLYTWTYLNDAADKGIYS